MPDIPKFSNDDQGWYACEIYFDCGMVRHRHTSKEEAEDCISKSGIHWNGHASQPDTQLTTEDNKDMNDLDSFVQEATENIMLEIDKRFTFLPPKYQALLARNIITRLEAHIEQCASDSST